MLSPPADRIRYDWQCFVIDGQDTFVFSGAFHYFRCPKPLWRERFAKIKAGGFNTVETYVPWNYHEREMPAGLEDFAKIDLTDLEDWLKMAHELGLYTIVRPGPYICAEWTGGGFPPWLMLKKPPDATRDLWLRSDDPVFLAWCKHWFDAVCPLIARYQITRQPAGHPGVILFQIENEYDYCAQPQDAKNKHLRALADDARRGGIEVPLFTCWTAQIRGSADPVLRPVFDTCNEYPRWDVESIRGHLETLRNSQVTFPLMIAELQGGWFSSVGGKLSEDQEGINAAQIGNLTLFAIQNGATALNYYMLFGGTNFGDTAASGITTTYDYNAPLRECGGVGDKYRAVQAIGRMLKEHGPALARSEPIGSVVENKQKNVVQVTARRGPDGQRFIFVRNRAPDQPRKGEFRIMMPGADRTFFEVAYDLEPFGSKILYLPAGATDASQGEWLPEPIAAPAAVEAPPPIRIATARRRADDGGPDWQAVQLGPALAALGIYDARYVTYRSRFTLPPELRDKSRHPWIKLLSADAVQVQLNGALLHPKVSIAGGTVYEVREPLPTPECDLRILFENTGYYHGGPPMEQPKGLADVRLVPEIEPNIELKEWRIKAVEGPGNRPEVAPGFDDSLWDPITVQPGVSQALLENKAATCVLRTVVSVSANALKAGQTFIEFGCIDDHGWIYVNGQKVGEAHDWRQPFRFDAAAALRPGQNVIAVIVKNDQGPGGLTQPVQLTSRLLESIPLTWELSPQLAGIVGRWAEPQLDDTGWEEVTLGQLRPQPHGGRPEALGPLVWYRLKFELPESPGQWVPWRITLDTSGNGFVYVNGHALGRYWEAGPQRAFYMPECWLNFGPGRTNVVTLCLRAIEHGAVLRAAEVAPYAEFVEKR